MSIARLLRFGLVPLLLLAACRRTTETVDGKAVLELGRRYSQGSGVRRDAVRAAALYDEACNDGEPEGCTHLGAMYLIGEGVGRDPSRAIQLLEKGCNGHHDEGCTELALLYRRGKTVASNPALAAELLDAACAIGRGPSPCTFLAEMYERGEGVARDPQRAGELYRQACLLGDEMQCGKAAQVFPIAAPSPTVMSGRKR